MNESGPLERLYRVQQLDLDLDQLQAEEGRVPEVLEGARREQERVNNALEDAEIELEGVEKQVRTLEGDLASTKDQIARSKAEQDKNAFDPKAQTQYQNRIQQLGDRITETEGDVQPLYERRRALEERRGELRAHLRELRPQIAQMERDDEARVQGLQSQQAGVRAGRDQAANTIEPRLYKEYTMIRRAKRGLGIVPIENGRCTGCNMQLPVTVQQRAGTGKLPAVKCPSCGRFLFKN